MLAFAISLNLNSKTTSPSGCCYDYGQVVLSVQGVQELVACNDASE